MDLLQDGHQLAPGDLVTPSIQLVKLLGQGGMGSVWVARHLGLHVDVVVKFMAAAFATNTEAMMRFQREAALAAQAKSPHVVQVFDHGLTSNGIPYIAMELLEGEDLGKRLEREGTIEPGVLATWLVQACRGLARAHAKGIVHRDIKPENVFLCDNDGEVLVKLLDFGIAKSFDAAPSLSATRTGSVLGTAYYMSPEQTLGAKDIDQRTDLWSLGVLAYLALTGSRPFDGETYGALAVAITSSPAMPPSRVNPQLSPAIDEWMNQALSRDRATRFSSAKEFADGLVRATNGRPSAVPQSSVSPSGTAAMKPLGGTVPVHPQLQNSTMSPSVRSSAVAVTNQDAAPPAHSRRGALIVGVLGLGLVLVGAASVVALKARGNGSAALDSVSGSVVNPQSAPALSSAANSGPVVAPSSGALAPSGDASLGPSSAPAPSSHVPPSRNSPPVRAVVASKASGSPALGPAVLAPAAAPVEAAKPASAPVNPLNMKIQ